VPAPAAGAVWTHKVDGRYYERLLAVTYTFTTSAVVANRNIVLNMLDSNGVIITQVPGSFALPASTVASDFFQVNSPSYDFAPGANTYRYLPDFLVPPGWSWNSSVSSIDVGDAFTGVVLLVQRFPNDAAMISAEY